MKSRSLTSAGQRSIPWESCQALRSWPERDACCDVWPDGDAPRGHHPVPCHPRSGVDPLMSYAYPGQGRDKAADLQRTSLLTQPADNSGDHTRQVLRPLPGGTASVITVGLGLLRIIATGIDIVAQLTTDRAAFQAQLPAYTAVSCPIHSESGSGIVGSGAAAGIQCSASLGSACREGHRPPSFHYGVQSAASFYESKNKRLKIRGYFYCNYLYNWNLGAAVRERNLA